MRKVLYTMTLLMSALTTCAQSIGEAFYIYMSDGRFEAFFRHEVDSITFATTDENTVVQRVCTPDSIYQFPVAAIDSVAFLTPQTIVNEKVFPLTAAHTPYINNGSTESFILSANAPENMRPKVGDIVVATADCDAFPDGIMALVQSVSTTSAGISYMCKRATLDDVFDQLVAYERLGTGNCYDFTDSDDDVVVQEGDSIFGSRRQLNRLEADKKYDLWDFGWKSEFGEDESKLQLGGRDVASMRLTVRKTLFTPLYVKVELANEFTATMDYHGEISADKEWSKQIGKTVTCGRIPIPYTMGLFWLEPKFSMFGYWGVSGKVSVDFSTHNIRTDTLSFVYYNKKWEFPHTMKDDPGVDVSRLSLDGSVEVGLKPVIDFSVNGSGVSFGVTGKIGIRETANFIFDAKGAADGSLYETVKDSYLRTTLPWSLMAQGSMNVFDDYDVNDKDKKQSKPIEPEDPPQLGEDTYFLPLFSNVYARGNSGDNSAAWCFATATRRCLLPLTLGFQLYDVMNQPQSAVYSSASYTTDRAPFSVDVNGLSGGQYTARPVINIMGYDLVAAPVVPVFKVATLDATQNGETVILKGKVYGTTTSNAGFYYGPAIGLMPGTSAYVQATLGTNGEFTATLDGVESGTLYFMAAADIPDHLGQTFESLGEQEKITIEAGSDVEEPTPGQAVDLGLSVKWAGWNVGASSPEEIGGFCGWGMANVSMTYDGSDYEHADKIKDGGKGKLGQLTQAKNELGSNICSTNYDAAHMTWGGGWRLPTSDECEELATQCTCKLVTYKERAGLMLTGPNGNRIFLPFSDSGSDIYWSGSASIYNYKNYIGALVLRQSGIIAGSGASVGAGTAPPSYPGIIRGVCK